MKCGKEEPGISGQRALLAAPHPLLVLENYYSHPLSIKDPKSSENADVNATCVLCVQMCMRANGKGNYSYQALSVSA